MFPTHPFSGVTVPVSGFLIVTRRLRDCVKSRNREGKGERHIRSAFGASATPSDHSLPCHVPGRYLQSGTAEIFKKHCF